MHRCRQWLIAALTAAAPLAALAGDALECVATPQTAASSWEGFNTAMLDHVFLLDKDRTLVARLSRQRDTRATVERVEYRPVVENGQPVTGHYRDATNGAPMEFKLGIDLYFTAHYSQPKRFAMPGFDAITMQGRCTPAP